MAYETSYESGRKPFMPDLTRGSWAVPSDFVVASMSLAFKLDGFSVLWFFFFKMGMFAFVPHLICLALFIVPMMVMQAFIGQFSSSGFISAFRVAPLFKGIGFISLGLNFAVLCYYSVFAAIPLLFFFNSLRPTLPWSCEGLPKWVHHVDEYDRVSICNITHTSTEVQANVLNTSLAADNETSSYYNTSSDYTNYRVPSVLFFRSHFGNANLNFADPNSDFIMCWSMVGCTLLSWAIIALVFYKYFNTAQLGKLLRYSILVVLSLLLVFVIRFLFLAGNDRAFKAYFHPDLRDIPEALLSSPIYVVSAFGGGWGALITLASFNRFKTNIMHYSWLIGLGHMLISMMFSFLAFIIEMHFTEITFENYYTNFDHHWIVYLSSGSAMASMHWANLWSLLFYGMLTLAAWVFIVTQIYSMLVSIFDEFEFLRARRTEVTFGTIGCLAFISLYFCSNQGIIAYAALSTDTIFTQAALNLLLLLIVLWIYGRERFQRDIEFMLSRRFETWKVNVLRFVAPIFLLFTLIIAIIFAVIEHFSRQYLVIQIFACILIVAPWLFIPGYAVFNLLKTTGSLKIRFRRCCRPTDWYPVESEDRQRYEESMGNMDITHQLSEVRDEVF